MKAGVIINVVVRLAIIVLAIGGLYAAHQQVQVLRLERATALVELEKTPDRLLEVAAQQADLDKHAFDIQRIDKYLITRENVVDVVSQIEQEGQVQGLTVQVPTIEEVIAAADGEKKVERANATVSDIEMNVSVDGDPDDIIVFAHRIEHLPYLISLQYMSLGNKGQPVSQGANSAVPLENKGVGEEVVPAAHAEFTFTLSVKKES